MPLLDLTGYGGGQPTLPELDPAMFGPEVGLLDPVTLARMRSFDPTKIKTGLSRTEINAARAAQQMPDQTPPVPAPAQPVPGLVRAPSPPNVPGPGRTSATGGPSFRPPEALTGLLAGGLPKSFGPVWGGMGQMPTELQLVRNLITGQGGAPAAGAAGRGIGSDVVASPPVDTVMPVAPVPGQRVGGPDLSTGLQPAGPVTQLENRPPLTPQEIAASQPAEKNWWDRSWGPVDDFLKKNANVFLGIGMGFGGARSIGEAFSRASAGVAEGAIQDRARNAINMSKQMLMAKGYSEEEADALANSPHLMQGALKNIFPSFQKVGEREDLYGKTSQYGYPAPPVERRIGPGGKYYVRHGNAWMVENP